MATKIPHKHYATYRFDKDLKEIYFRIDTEDTYEIVLVPETTTIKEFPPRSIIIASKGLTASRRLCSVKPGECVKLTKVNRIRPFFFNQTLRSKRYFLYFFQTINATVTDSHKMVEFISQEQFSEGVENNDDSKIIYYAVTELNQRP